MPDAIPDELVVPMAENFRLLGDPTRLAILKSLLEGEKSVGGLVERTGQSQANVSRNLKLLARAGLVNRRKEGLHVFYRVGTPWVEPLCRASRELVISGIRETLDRQGELLDHWGSSTATEGDRVEQIP